MLEIVLQIRIFEPPTLTTPKGSRKEVSNFSLGRNRDFSNCTIST